MALPLSLLWLGAVAAADASASMVAGARHHGSSAPRQMPVAAGTDNTVATAVPPPFANCSAQCAGAPLPLNDTVPNVLLVSDSIGASGTGYFTNVAAMLDWNASTVTGSGPTGIAQVQHSGFTGMKGACGTSFGVLACAEPWLAGAAYANGTRAKFDVIHFNWGLHDICASMYAPVTTDQYVANMEQLYTTLRAHLAPGGALVFATTTPVPASYTARNNSDVLVLNAAAQGLFGPDARHPEVLVHDLYTETVNRCRRAGIAGYPDTEDCVFLQSNGVHYSAMGRQYTGVLTAAAVAAAL